MFGRPRCREWTPLATQQLRLRSLIQIVGYNIRPPEWCMTHCSFYVTLHHTTMSAPFYTSERISSPHPKWKEIDSEITQCMSSTNVVIRIWCHIPVLSKEMEDQDDKPQDAVIQTWGIYFSGLRYIGANLALNFTSDSFKSNTLVFQMHGGYFCSYKSLKLDVIPPENELEHGSLSSDSSGKISLYKNSLEPKFIQNHKLLKESRSVSPCKYGRTDKEYSKSNSPVERGLSQNFQKMKTSASLNISKSHREICYRKKDECDDDRNTDPYQIYEHSPDNLDIKEFTSRIDCNNLSKNASNEELCGSKIDLSETAESYDLRNETDGSPKYRYLALSFLKSEIRPSYNASKLQKLHLLQYSIKKKQEAVQEIKERIYKKSALNDCWSPPNEQNLQPKLRSRSQKNLFSPEETDLNKKPSPQKSMNIKNGKISDDKAQITNSSRLNLKLSDLLSYKAQPSPLQIAEHLRLTKQLEILRFKRIILADERNTKLANIRRLKEKYAKLSEENQDLGSELMECYHNLSKNNEALKETRQSCGALLELAARSHAALANRRSQLLGQLRQIFLIEEKDASNWTICDVPLPICDDDNHRNLNPVSDAVAAGLVAQATFLAAVILNQPLRYKLTLLGSASKILDITPDLPDPNIPLFARGGDITLFRYGMFLLNKCIAQLLWGRGAPVTDMRPTLSNLHRLLTKPSNLSDTSKLFGAYKWLVENRCARTQSLRSMVASDRGKYRQFNRFKDSIDGQSPQSVMNLRRHRHSKSVGSCNDDQDTPTLDASTTSLMGSAPNIYNTKLLQTNSDVTEPLKTHSSDSEISKLTDNRLSESESRVVFTLGEDTLLTDLNHEKLVKISSNNGDELSCATCLSDVRRICSEIENYCSSVEEPEIHQACDIAKHIEPNRNIDISKYMSNESVDVDCNCDGGTCRLVCAKKVTDVIVLPSSEAVLGTGSVESHEQVVESVDLINKSEEQSENV